jgi:hypothetical protein
MDELSNKTVQDGRNRRYLFWFTDIKTGGMNNENRNDNQEKSENEAACHAADADNGAVARISDDVTRGE